ncbi:MAG: glutamate--cysteine ligase [Pseudomonadales bacterium]|nr:glutamate--cysteine ligase [Pseudomonadales bacterium]
MVPASAKTTRSQGNINDKGMDFLSSEASASCLRNLQRGIEKEGLRTTPEGFLALSPHPDALGSALTNSWITTDFSESLLEFITPVHETSGETLDFLSQAHALVAQRMPNEIMWAASMPCVLPTDQKIPLAQYGNSNIGQMKTAYRRGLGHRYGRAMQTVAGIHYNFSMPDEYWLHEKDAAGFERDDKDLSTIHYVNRRYLDLIRNFRRDYWLLIYLFGAAPCVDRSFVQGRSHNLETLSPNDLYLPYATSLRMGDLGYQSIAQQSLFICYNDLDNYVATLHNAMKTPYDEYKKYGVSVNNEYQQLSSSLLQIENEFYSPIRPKRATNSGEKPLHALQDRGIQYIEVRCLDINPFTPLGIDSTTSHFIDAFLISCLHKSSPRCTEKEFKTISENQARVVNRGRDPNLTILANGSEVSLRERAATLMKSIAEVATILDQANNTSAYSESVTEQHNKILDITNTPSAQLLTSMKDSDSSFVEFTLAQSKMFMEQHHSQVLNKKITGPLIEVAEASLAKQAVIEDGDTLIFDKFLANYFAS